METLRCSKNSFHAFAEKQNWLLLFDKVNDLGSEISYMLSNGNTLFVVFDIDGYFDRYVPVKRPLRINKSRWNYKARSTDMQNTF